MRIVQRNNLRGFDAAHDDQCQIVDLLLEQKGDLAIVVEVKVKQEEDGQQIRQYRDWLDEVKGRKNYVFHLIKTHKPGFDITAHGGMAMRKWKELYDYLSSTEHQAARCSQYPPLPSNCESAR